MKSFGYGMCLVMETQDADVFAVTSGCEHVELTLLVSMPSLF